MDEYKIEISRVLIELIRLLEKAGLINRIDFIEQLGAIDLYVFKKSKKYNYSVVAKQLEKMPVFLPIDRKRAVYAKKILEKELGRKVSKKKAMVGYMEGYIFTVAD